MHSLQFCVRLAFAAELRAAAPLLLSAGRAAIDRYLLAAGPRPTADKKLSYRRGTARCVVSIDLVGGSA